MRKNAVLLLIVLALLLQGLVPRAGVAAPPAQTDTEAKVQALLDQMTTEEKIGQLFLVSFTGDSITSDSQIYDLIVNHHIGGVVLEAKNNNFVQGENTLPAAQALIQALQQAEYDASQPTNVEPASPTTDSPQYIPLFVGISQNGDGYPYDQIYSGLTELPSPMALGATWNPELAEQVGTVAGQELSALGFNLLLGPSLDVLEDPNPESSGDLGVRTFGGDSYWVGQMGSAYIRGVHAGSSGQMAVIAKNFPGYGSADRPPQEEVATIRKSLDQLKLLELVAFYPVTGKATTEAETADGLLLSHIRYSGLLGNIRYTTPPITFDTQTFNTILGEPEFATWKEAGGIVITDDLSSLAVRRYYGLSNTSFQAWQVTRDAFNAGNDLLFVGNITSSDAEDSYTSIINALTFFAERYGRDLDFKERVDLAVSRLLTLKLKLYGTFVIENVLPKEENLINIGQSDSVVLNVARQGITLLSPSLEDLETVLPNPPKLDDRIVFITDTSSYQQCGVCPENSTLGPETLQQAVYQLYGLDAGSRVIRQNLSSFTFDDLQSMLDNPGSFHEVLERMKSAQWLVFSMLDVKGARFASQSLRRMLSDREELIQSKNVIVFAFNAPYYLDQTDISKIDAYYALYSKSPQFVESAARILFDEFTPTEGALPVSVPGLNYTLSDNTLPDSNQLIQVYLESPTGSIPPTETPSDQEPIPNVTPTPLADVKIGQVIKVYTGIIYDHNGNPVPDRTVVNFRFSLTGETKTAETVGGIASTTYIIQGGGQLEIQADSPPAPASAPLVLNIPGPEATLIPTMTPSPTNGPSPTSTPTLSPTPVVTPTPTTELHDKTDLVDWGLSFLVTLAISLFAYWSAIGMGQVKWSVRWALCTWITGFLSYIYIALNLPGSTEFLLENGRIGIIWAIALGSASGWSIGWIWKQMIRPSRPWATPEASVPAKTKNG